MKKIFVATLMTTVALSLCACSGTSSNTTGVESTEYIFCTKEEVQSFFAPVDLTKENWSDYIEVKEVEDNETDAFGEISTFANYWKVISKEDVSGFVSDDFAIEIQYKKKSTTEILDAETEEVLSTESDDFDGQTFSSIVQNLDLGNTLENAYSFSPSAQFDYQGRRAVSKHITDLTVVGVSRIQGQFTTWSIPDEKWNTDDDGKRFIAVEHTLNNGRVGLIKLYENGVMVKQREHGKLTTSSERDNPSGWDLSELE